MSMVWLLSRCALAQVIGESAEGVMKSLGDRFSGRSRQLIDVLHTANEKAWKAVEISLAGESLWNRLDPSAEKSLREQIRILLDNMRLPILTHRDEFRKLCLHELRQAKRAGHLLGKPTAEELHRSLGAFASDRDREEALAQERAAIMEMVAILERERYTNLAWLVGHEVQPGQGLLVVAVQFFFRRAIESNEELRTTLQLSRLEKLSETQTAGFVQLEVLLASHGQKLEQLLDSVLFVALETRDAVFDLHREQQKHGDRLEDVYELLGQLLEQARLQHRREVRPGDTRSIRGPHDRRRVQQLVDRYQSLPEYERRQRPALLHSVALLQVAAGETQAAKQHFEQLAEFVGDDPKAKAQARYNGYQAALAQHDYDSALEALREAVALDPEGYAPFPFSDYLPECILGAGGFGVAFKCQHATLKRPLVVKALWLDGLDRSLGDVCREAQVLNDLDHPAIIHLRDLRFADAAKTRPFLVMDYFESLSLTAHVRQHGPLTPVELLPIARTIAEALQSAHAQGILHRDVKPENVLVRQAENGSWRVKLIDFGLAVKQEAIEATVRASELPRECTIAGTIDYAAPEQMGRLPGVPVGPYSDVYGFAKTCYFALLGTPEPDDTERASLEERWRKLLSACSARKVENRLKDFAVVLERLHEMDSASAPRAGEKPKDAPPQPARVGRVPPRYIETSAAGSVPVSNRLALSSLWMGGEEEVEGAVPVEEQSCDTMKKPKRGPLG